MSQPGATIDRSVQELDAATDLESEVRAYSRTWPAVFARADGARIYASDGRPYLDFFMGAGALNYGHNNPLLREALVDYLQEGGVVHSLDMLTETKVAFLQTLQELVLAPRGLDYKVQFTGPTGTNCVEAALKLARKVTGRSTIAAFTRAFHGVSLGSLAVTASGGNRAGAGVPLDHVLRLPYEGFGKRGVSGLDLLEDLTEDPSSGVELPAAVIVETVQGEGGVNVASPTWLRRLAELCASRDMLLVVDDVQAGCGRTGPFFSFERAGIEPDVVCLSKSISGFGLPMALTLFKRELDVWRPGEHNGTFRGFNPAQVTAAAALRAYWSDDRLRLATEKKGEVVASCLEELCERHAPLGLSCRGSGLMWGLVFDDPAVAAAVGRAAFERGLLVETVGSRDEVVKLLPSLLITAEELTEGLQILDDAIAEAAAAAA